jgi:hypothetical protein
MQLTLVTFVFCIVLLTLAKHTSYFTSCISRCKPLTLEEDTLILPYYKNNGRQLIATELVANKHM